MFIALAKVFLFWVASTITITLTAKCLVWFFVGLENNPERSLALLVLGAISSVLFTVPVFVKFVDKELDL